MQGQKTLGELDARYDQFTQDMADPAVMADQDRYQKTAKATAEISEVVDKYRQWKWLQSELKGTRSMLEESDPEMVALAEQEIAGLEERAARLEAEIKILMIPKDPDDEKGVVLEVRAGTGGDEATLFAAEIFRMYGRFAEERGWKVATTSK